MKFLHKVSHITFNGKNAVKDNQSVMYITERAVFSLSNGVLQLDELAPGVDIETDIIPHMDANFIISANCKTMCHTHFCDMDQIDA
jgi:propionate CoA-transferase